jgi:flavin-dependent dehydrogenase
MKYDAIIIGAGPAGGTCALLLARAGWSVAVIEQAAFPRRKVCGEFLSATNWPLLRELGLEEVFRNSAGPAVHRVGLFCGDKIVAARMPGASAAGDAFGRALGREALDLLLLERARQAGASVLQPWRAVGVRRAGSEHVCTIESKGERLDLRAPILLAAHGSWQPGPLPTQTATPHRPADLLAFKAHFEDGRLAPDLMPLVVFRGGYGGMVWSSAGRLGLSCCVRRDVLQEHRRRTSASAGEAVLDLIRRSCRGVDEALEGARLHESILAAGPIRPGIRVADGPDGVLRLGNVAGEAHPIVAEGISMAMQSAWLASRLLIARQSEALAGHGGTELAAAYAHAWKRQFAPRLRAAAIFAHGAMRPAAAASLSPLIERFPALLTFGARLSGKAAPMPFAFAAADGGV